MRLSDRDWYPAAVSFVVTYIMAATVGTTVKLIVAIGGLLTGH